MLGAGAGQTLSVTFTPDDTATYDIATATVTITVLKATPVITWPTPAAITYGTALGATQLNATAPAGVAGTFVYTPASGVVLGAGAGQTLSVTFTPTNTADYTVATATVEITVLKATPAITWPTPAAITYGTALSSDAVECDRAGWCSGHVCLYAGERRGAGRGRGADVVGDLHPDQHRGLHRGHGDRRDHRAEGDAGDHLANTGADHLWHGAGCDAAERDRPGGRGGHVRVYAGRAARCSARASARRCR